MSRLRSAIRIMCGYQGRDVRCDGATVLVIEDDEATRAMVIAALADEGYVAIGARDGGEGIRLALEHRPALILLDLLMPRGSGLTFLEEHRADGLRRTPVVVMTAAGDRDQEEVRSLVDGVLTKPFDIDELIDVAQRYCRP
jgi:DNA-binding response OmpR family regulator